ncbi:aldehyde dehydrogenase family protein [uncultured Jatrophihabitans sp.]|uniref:aldehyde dehydrogenase family protein n=1 Tax=uncultured Jatrophihabitans sp. TaxID=1610747 RepID=UPI0035CB26B5
MADLSYTLFIDGKYVDASGDATITVINPATEERIGVVPEGTVEDAKRAVGAARRAFDDGPWGRSTPRERAKVLSAMADIMTRRYAELVDLNIAEAGSIRPLAEFLQVGVPIEHLRDFAERVLYKYDFETPQAPYIGAGGMAGIGQGIVQREAIGVVSLITAYNFPLFLNMFKLAPALAAGCTAILKPSPDTPLEALILGEIADEAGLPPGVLNIVTGGIEASAELTTNPAVDMVSFTGSDAVGRRVYSQATDTLKRVVLELGGKSANIICEGTDLEKVMPHIIMNFTTHAGQGCSLQTRTLVHESMFDDVVHGLKTALDGIKVGDPSDPSVTMGPLISEAQRGRVEALIRSGLDEGGQIAYGGGRPTGIDKGFFVEPTVFVDMDNSMTLSQREVFGPVSVMLPFATDDEAVKIANDSDFGLGGGVWAPDPVRAFELARRLRTGQVVINGGGGGGLSPYSPFGGYKQSGLGREWGAAGMEEYLQTKAITWGVAGA